MHRPWVPQSIAMFSRILGWWFEGKARLFLERLLASRADYGFHEKVLASLEPGVYALYIHMPFCRQPLCKFCCFVRYPYEPRASRLYTRLLVRELELLASRAEAARVGVVYVGGGTPSVDVQGLVEVLDAVRRLWGRGVRISVEASPRDLVPETVEALQGAGVERLSMGVQALNPDRLERVGRRNTSLGDALRAVKLVRGRFPTVNIDMLWGAPGDTVEEVAKEARAALGLGVDQVTFYPLMPPPAHREWLRDNMAGPWSPWDREMYTAILSEALRAGYTPSTPWCMQRGAGLIDEYVVDYDRFLAAGVSGIARLGGYVYVNTFNLQRYTKLLEAGKLPVALAAKPKPLEDALYHASSILFGLTWCPGRLAEKYGRHGWLVESFVEASLKTLGEPVENHSCTRLSKPATLYALHVAQRSLYSALSMFRRKAITLGV